MTSSLQKKLLFRAWHRGTREADLLMGRFAEANLPQFSQEQLMLFQKLLDETDPDIYDWITERSPLPSRDIAKMLEAMIAFYRIDK